jgi:hypothetical protein
VTPAETIQAAIEKLTEQRDAAMQGPWRGRVLNHWGTPTPGVWADEDGDYIGYSMNQADADLLVTLHATIDAQLAILQEGHQVCVNLDEIGFTGNPGRARPSFDLARAILGEQVDA